LPDGSPAAWFGNRPRTPRLPTHSLPATTEWRVSFFNLHVLSQLYATRNWKLYQTKLEIRIPKSANSASYAILDRCTKRKNVFCNSDFASPSSFDIRVPSFTIHRFSRSLTTWLDNGSII